jgi:hypothetical protein
LLRDHDQPLAGLEPWAAAVAVSADEVVCEERLGSLLKHYHRKAA